MEKTHFTSDPPQVIGQRIRNERSKWNLTQEQLSEHLGISTNYLGQIERGRSFSHALAKRFCEFFHITYDYLYYGANAPREQAPSDTDKELEHLLQLLHAGGKASLPAYPERNSDGAAFVSQRSRGFSSVQL